MIALTEDQSREILGRFAEYVLYEGTGKHRKRKPANDWDCNWEELEYTPAMVGLAIEAVLAGKVAQA